MSDILYREFEVPCTLDEAWDHVVDPTWLGDEGELEPREGAEGWVLSDGDVKYLLVEEAQEARRLVYRWASFSDVPSRVEIELAPGVDGTRISISESPLAANAQACLALR